MLDDAMEPLDDADLDDEADEEVDKVLFDLTAGDCLLFMLLFFSSYVRYISKPRTSLQIVEMSLM